MWDRTPGLSVAITSMAVRADDRGGEGEMILLDANLLSDQPSGIAALTPPHHPHPTSIATRSGSAQGLPIGTHGRSLRGGLGHAAGEEIGVEVGEAGAARAGGIAARTE